MFQHTEIGLIPNRYADVRRLAKNTSQNLRYSTGLLFQLYYEEQGILNFTYIVTKICGVLVVGFIKRAKTILNKTFFSGFFHVF